jgi:hypothetical protein
MGVAKKVEQRLEGLVEGFFARVFRSGLQPVEVGRRILREMADNTTISVNRTYAPNHFRVVMGPQDHARFAQMEAGLAREFSELIIDQAKAERVHLMGLPHIEFVADDSLGPGQFRVETSHAADPDLRARAPKEPTQGFATARGMPELILLKDGRPERRLVVERIPAVIGRLATSDIVIDDPNVSRRHAELRRDDDGWLLVDLGSTNGSLVNGKLAREHRLSDGDRLTLGSSELIFRTND